MNNRKEIGGRGANLFARLKSVWPHDLSMSQDTRANVDRMFAYIESANGQAAATRRFQELSQAVSSFNNAHLGGSIELSHQNALVLAETLGRGLLPSVDTEIIPIALEQRVLSAFINLIRYKYYQFTEYVSDPEQLISTFLTDGYSFGVRATRSLSNLPSSGQDDLRVAYTICEYAPRGSALQRELYDAGWFVVGKPGFGVTQVLLSRIISDIQ